MVELHTERDEHTGRVKATYRLDEEELKKVVADRINEEFGTEIQPEFIKFGHYRNSDFFAETWTATKPRDNDG